MLVFARAIALSVLLVSSIQGATKEQVEAIKNYAFQGTVLGTSLDDFKKKFPQAEVDEDESDAKNGKEVFWIEEVKGVDTVRFFFLDKKLYQVSFDYLPDTLNKIGTWTTLVERLTAKYGKPTEVLSDDDARAQELVAFYSWNFVAANRFIELTVESNGALVEFTEMKTFAELINRLKKNAEVGF
jgi:hypothetical protein